MIDAFDRCLGKKGALFRGRENCNISVRLRVPRPISARRAGKIDIFISQGGLGLLSFSRYLVIGMIRTGAYGLYLSSLSSASLLRTLPATRARIFGGVSHSRCRLVGKLSPCPPSSFHQLPTESLKFTTPSFMSPSSSKPVLGSHSCLLGVYSRIFAKRASPIQGSWVYC